MSVTSVFAGLLQLLLAGLFAVMLIAFRSVGPRAQRALDEAAVRQGIAPEVLVEHGVRLDEGRGAYIAGYAIAAVLASLAALNLAGSGIGRVLSWILEPAVLLGVGYVTTMQVFAIPATVAAFAKIDDPRMRGLDVRAVLHAAAEALPAWYRPAIVLRWLLATVGSVAVIVLLALPSATA